MRTLRQQGSFWQHSRAYGKAPPGMRVYGISGMRQNACNRFHTALYGREHGCDLSLKVTRLARVHPWTSRNSFRERCQVAPGGCAVFSLRTKYAPHFTHVKASPTGRFLLDAARNPIQLSAPRQLSQQSTDLFSDVTGNDFTGPNRTDVRRISFNCNDFCADIRDPHGLCRAALGPGDFSRVA